MISYVIDMTIIDDKEKSLMSNVQPNFNYKYMAVQALRWYYGVYINNKFENDGLSV